MAKSWAKQNTLVYCEHHGWVAGRFGEATPKGMCRHFKYYIEYCCGLRCTSEKPKSIYEEIMKEEPQSSEQDKKVERDA